MVVMLTTMSPYKPLNQLNLLNYTFSPLKSNVKRTRIATTKKELSGKSVPDCYADRETEIVRTGGAGLAVILHCIFIPN